MIKSKNVNPQSAQITAKTMSNQNGFAGQQIEKEGLDVFEFSHDVFEVPFGNPAESRVVVNDGIVGFDERVVNNLQIGRDDRDAGQFAAFRRVAHLAIHGAIISIVIIIIYHHLIYILTDFYYKTP
jgi:hypothetical protein